MTKYKTGDKVRIKSDLKVGEYYGRYLFTTSMKPILHITIQNVYKDDYSSKENGFSWTDEMIEGLVEEEESLTPDERIIKSLNEDLDDKYHEDLMKASIAAMQGLCGSLTNLEVINALIKTSEHKNASKATVIAKMSIEIATELLTQLKLEQK